MLSIVITSSTRGVDQFRGLSRWEYFGRRCSDRYRRLNWSLHRAIETSFPLFFLSHDEEHTFYSIYSSRFASKANLLPDGQG